MIVHWKLTLLVSEMYYFFISYWCPKNKINRTPLWNELNNVLRKAAGNRGKNVTHAISSITLPLTNSWLSQTTRHSHTSTSDTSLGSGLVVNNNNQVKTRSHANIRLIPLPSNRHFLKCECSNWSIFCARIVTKTTRWLLETPVNT